MRPFDITNRMGLSNAYTDNMYEYAPRPSQTGCQSGCGEYLFCDTRTTPHCVSKIKLNGNCRGFEGLDACHQGICLNGFCVPGQIRPTPPPFASTTMRTRIRAVPQAASLDDSNGLSFSQSFQNVIGAQPRTQIPVPASLRRQNPQQSLQQSQRARFSNATAAGCFNDDPCCSAWARLNECSSNPSFMQRYCQVLKKIYLVFSQLLIHRGRAVFVTLQTIDKGVLIATFHAAIGVLLVSARDDVSGWQRIADEVAVGVILVKGIFVKLLLV